MARRREALVTQHLENVSREVLERYQQIAHGFIRGRHGVYALYRRGKLYYVGLATNLRGRLKSHLRDRHGESWDRFSVYLTIGDQHMRELEALMLRISKPSGNKVKGRFAKSEDIRRRFRRAIRQVHRAEERALFTTVEKAAKPVVAKAVQADRRPGRRSALARYLSAPTKIRVRYKGTLYRAVIRRDGSILLAGKRYLSPSLAGESICGHACNGWVFWQYERSPGDWVLLRHLRD